MATLYELLLCLYPAIFRDEFGDEMTAVFRNAQSALPSALTTKLSFYTREYCGLFYGALSAQLYRLSEPGIPIRRLNMKSQFRFHRATVALLIVNLIGAMFIIAKGKAMSHVTPMGTVFSSVAIHLVVFALLALCGAAVFWAILHNLRRTGVHRLESMPTGTSSASSISTR